MGALSGRKSPPLVQPQKVYNRLQDIRAHTIVLDVRPLEESVAARPSSAHRLDAHAQSAVSLALRLGELINTSFAEVNGTFSFVVAVCCSRVNLSKAAVQRVVSAVAARQWSLLAQAQEIWMFDWDDYYEKFPFACSNHEGFQDDRLLPSVVSVNPRVYISSWALASDEYIFKSIKPTHIVNCTVDHPHVFEAGSEYVRVAVDDNSEEDLLKHLDAAVRFIEEAVRNGGAVLCHCRHGQSRSAPVVAAWCVASKRWSLNEALTHMKACRPKVSPNSGFIVQLERWAQFQQLFGMAGPSDQLRLEPVCISREDSTESCQPPEEVRPQII